MNDRLRFLFMSLGCGSLCGGVMAGACTVIGVGMELLLPFLAGVVMRLFEEPLDPKSTLLLSDLYAMGRCGFLMVKLAVGSFDGGPGSK